MFVSKQIVYVVLSRFYCDTDFHGLFRLLDEAKDYCDAVNAEQYGLPLEWEDEPVEGVAESYSESTRITYIIREEEVS